MNTLIIGLLVFAALIVIVFFVTLIQGIASSKDVHGALVDASILTIAFFALMIGCLGAVAVVAAIFSLALRW